MVLLVVRALTLPVFMPSAQVVVVQAGQVVLPFSTRDQVPMVALPVPAASQVAACCMQVVVVVVSTAHLIGQVALPAWVQQVAAMAAPAQIGLLPVLPHKLAVTQLITQAQAAAVLVTPQAVAPVARALWLSVILACLVLPCTRRKVSAALAR